MNLIKKFKILVIMINNKILLCCITPKVPASLITELDIYNLFLPFGKCYKIIIFERASQVKAFIEFKHAEELS